MTPTRDQIEAADAYAAYGAECTRRADDKVRRFITVALYALVAAVLLAVLS